MNSEKKLVKKILKGKKKAINEFYQQYSRSLFSFIKKRVKTTEDAEDILQETLVSALNSLPNFRFRSSLFSWLCAIARHEIADFYRKQKIKTVLFSKMPFLEGIANQALNPEERYLRHELEKEMSSAFQQLSEGFSKILRLKYIDGSSMRTIAKKLKITVKAVESRLTRARKNFRKIWQKNH